MRAAMAVAAARFVTPQLSHKATRIRFGHWCVLAHVPVVKSRSALAGVGRGASEDARGPPMWAWPKDRVYVRCWHYPGVTYT
jgi:hypothetical protein